MAPVSEDRREKEQRCGDRGQGVSEGSSSSTLTYIGAAGDVRRQATDSGGKRGKRSRGQQNKTSSRAIHHRNSYQS